VGIGGDRIDMYNISSSMGPQFAKIATEFTERIKELGPTPINIARRKSEGTK
jgi:coenzyme F420-reducing hydrogenase delta subunit